MKKNKNGGADKIMRMENSVRILHKHNRRFCCFQEKRYICIELFDEMQSTAVQRSYTVAKSLLATFLISALHCHSDRYIKDSYPLQRYWKKRELASPQEFNYLCPINADLWVCNKIMMSRGGGVLLRPMEIKSALPDSMGRVEPCPCK